MFEGFQNFKLVPKRNVKIFKLVSAEHMNDFSKLVDFAYNIDVHNFLGGFASEFVKLVSTEHIDGQKILSWF